MQGQPQYEVQVQLPVTFTYKDHISYENILADGNCCSAHVMKGGNGNVFINYRLKITINHAVTQNQLTPPPTMGTMSAIEDDIVVVAELLLVAIVYRLLCISFLFYTDSWSQCSGDQGNTLGTISVTGEVSSGVVSWAAM